MRKREESLMCTLAATNTEDESNPEEWKLDSGATSHVTNAGELDDYKPLEQKYIQTADGKRLRVVGIGTYRGRHLIDGVWIKIQLKETLYVPELKHRLISVSRLWMNGMSTIFGSETSRVFRTSTNETILHVTLDRGLYVVRILPDATERNEEDIACTINDETPSIDLYHKRYGHIGERRLRNALKAQGIIFPADQNIKQCEVCIESKQTRAPIGSGPVERAEKPLVMVHTDLCGPMRTPTTQDNRYFATFIDDYSRYASVYLLKRKSDFPMALQAYLKRTEIEGRTLRILRSDQGGEYMSKEVARILENKGIMHSTAPSHTPELNGVAERFNRTIMTMVRSLLLTSGLDHAYWGEALRFAVYVNNRLTTVANKDNVTPYERWTGKSGTLNHIRSFGCRAFVLRPGPRDKLRSLSQRAIYLGPANNFRQTSSFDVTKYEICSLLAGRHLPREYNASKATVYP